MRTYWGIQGGESVELYDGQDAKDSKIIYRICVERLVKCEVKIIRGPHKPKIINNDSRSKVVDVVVSQGLFIEVIGANSFAYGWYEYVGPT